MHPVVRAGNTRCLTDEREYNVTANRMTLRELRLQSAPRGAGKLIFVRVPTTSRFHARA